MNQGVAASAILAPVQIGSLRELLTQANPPVRGRVRSGLEETMVRLAQAVPVRSVLAIQRTVLEQRGGLEELAARIPGEGTLSTLILEGDDPVQWTATLLGRDADSIVFVGDPVLGAAVDRMLPDSMTMTVLDPGAALQKIFLALGVDRSLLDTVNWAGLEERRQPLQSA